jgi:DNA-binding GntR family transcriptional regulator
LYTLDARVFDVHISPVGRAPSPPPTLTDQAYASIRSMIFEGRLPAGSHVTEAALVRQLDMSRTPIREALTRLATEGQLLASPGRGFIVVEISAADLIDIYGVRARLEGLATEEAAERCSRTDLARLEDLYEAMETARTAGEDERLAFLNGQFHAVVAQASGNAYLQAMLDDIREVFDRFRTTALALPGRRDDAHHEHGQLIEALRRRDRGAARELGEQHVERALAARHQVLSRAAGQAERTTS